MRYLLFILTCLSLRAQPMPLVDTNSCVHQAMAVWEMPFDTNVTGFYLYFEQTNRIDCGLLTYYRFTYTGSVPTIAVSSYSTSGKESVLVYESNTVPIRRFQLVLPIPCAIGSTDMLHWYGVTNVELPMDQPQEFFRTVTYTNH